jgi:RND superfamily putative drug exporter
MRRISAWCFDHRFLAIGGWVLALVVVFGVGGAIGPAYDSTLDIPDSDSADGFAVLEARFPELGIGSQSGTIVFRASQGVDDPAVQAAMTRLFSLVDAGFPDAAGVPSAPGATVVSPYSSAGAGQIATSGPLAGRLAYAQVNLAPDVDMTEASAIGSAITSHAPSLDGLEVVPGGGALAPVEPLDSELVGLAFAVVVLMLAFGSVLAMGLPVAVALSGVGAGIGSMLLLSHLYSVPDFTLSVGVMIGLGVGIDYALFIVTRYREGTHAGLSPRSATLAAIDSSGRAVVFAAITVVISLLGMLIMGIRLVTGVGLGASVTVLLTMVSSLTLLPALLGLARHRVEVTRWRGLLAAGCAALALLGAGLKIPVLAAVGLALAVTTLLASFAVRPLRREVPRRPPRPQRSTLAYRWSRAVQRHPVQAVALGSLVLLLLAAPVLALRLGVADEGNFPDGTSTRRAYDLLAKGFGPGFNGPFLITAVPSDLITAVPSDASGSATNPSEAVEALRRAMAGTPGVAAVTEPVADDPASPGAFVMTLVPTTAPQAEATNDLVTRLRHDVIPAAVGGTGLDVDVTGAAAANIDLTNYLGRRVFVFFGAVLGLSFVLLLLVFRSLLVPAKAVLMNVLAMAATYGVIVVVFQWGWGGSLLGVAGAPIEPFIPMILFAIVFGLSMDYEVFLLSRVREEYERTEDPVGSVADGLAATARVITAAAAIMVVVFGSFVFEENRVLKMFGLGLAVAVLLDATLIRMLLVPATMELLGARNWWLPTWLARRLPTLPVAHAPTSPAAAPLTVTPPEDDGGHGRSGVVAVRVGGSGAGRGGQGGGVACAGVPEPAAPGGGGPVHQPTP